MRIRNVRGRSAFTLIELLVVISIIAVLMGLLMSGVMAVIQARDRSANAYDVNKLSEAMQIANQKYANTKSLPGKLVLCNNIGQYSAAPPSGATYTAAELNYSKDALRRMFGARLLEPNASGTYATVNWDGSGNASHVTILEGTQCLVFYLGGVADTSSGQTRMLGFSSAVQDPVAAGGTDRIGPFYEFETKRLTVERFPRYLDRYGTPFAYFGNRGAKDTYVSHNPSLGAFCPNSSTNGPAAYQESTTPARWTKPDTFQIISAGRDKKFGAGGLWTPSAGTSDVYGKDDQSNFSQSQLGTGS